MSMHRVEVWWIIDMATLICGGYHDWVGLGKVRSVMTNALYGLEY